MGIKTNASYGLKTCKPFKLELPIKFQYTDSMKIKKEPISGAIFSGVQTRCGRHEYEEGNPEVVEIKFQGYNSTYVNVIDYKTARELMNHLKDILPPNYIEL